MRSALTCLPSATSCFRGTDVADPNVEAVRAKLLDRSQVGILKYGVTTERGDLSLRDWLTHLQEELMDAAVYIEAALKATGRPDEQ